MTMTAKTCVNHYNREDFGSLARLMQLIKEKRAPKVITVETERKESRAAPAPEQPKTVTICQPRTCQTMLESEAARRGYAVSGGSVQQGGCGNVYGAPAMMPCGCN